VRALAIDVGSSSIRTALVSERGAVTHVHQRRLNVRTPSPGEVELDPTEIITLVFELAKRTLHDGGGADVVGITNQRATTVVFDPSTGEAVGPALGWQDLRTVLDCLVLQGEGVRLAPNQSATKIRWLINQSSKAARDLRFATLETWIAWHLSGRELFVTDRSNASVTGLVDRTAQHWDEELVSRLELDVVMLPHIVDTMGALGTASALSGLLPITAMVGDQPASLFGQSCVKSGAKITFGTGAMLDIVHGVDAPASLSRFASGCYPTVLASRKGAVTWGVEGIILSAGSCVEWLVDLGLISDVNESDVVAQSVASSDGVGFVPAFSGLGTPQWDFGARGGFFGLTRGSTKAHLVRAVLEGIAQRGADLLDAVEIEIGYALEELHIDGGMSTNRFFVQKLADFSGHNIEVSSEREATTRGAGLMALVGADHLSREDVEGLWQPGYVATPLISGDEREETRRLWRRTLERAAKTIPELSSITF
jgi:glycerol kinase